MKYSFPNRKFGTNNANTTYRSIEASIIGSLVFEETDMGPWVEKNAPGADYDYETYSTVKNENIENLLIELVKEHYPDHVAFRTFLESKGIDYDFFSC